jgi:hypothetical protein
MKNIPCQGFEQMFMIIAIFLNFHNIYIILKLKGVKNVDEGVYWDIIKLKG